MVRSEEEVSFGVAPPEPRERVRLRKHVVVEHVEKTVPVRREEIRLEHEPPPSGKSSTSKTPEDSTGRRGAAHAPAAGSGEDER